MRSYDNEETFVDFLLWVSEMLRLPKNDGICKCDTIQAHGSRVCEVMNVAARLTDKQKKKIIADYVESGSYRATAKKFGVSDNTVKKICNENADIAQKCAQKKNKTPLMCLTIWSPEKNRQKRYLILT